MKAPTSHHGIPAGNQVTIRSKEAHYFECCVDACTIMKLTVPTDWAFWHFDLHLLWPCNWISVYKTKHALHSYHLSLCTSVSCLFQYHLCSQHEKEMWQNCQYISLWKIFVSLTQCCVQCVATNLPHTLCVFYTPLVGVLSINVARSWKPESYLLGIHAAKDARLTRAGHS